MSRIFVVDDDLAMEVMSDSLRFRGHEVERIGSAQDTLDRMDELVRADLVILDIIMTWPDARPATGLQGPASAGMEVLLEIRKRNTSLPIIVYSATQDTTITTALDDIPGCLFISKWERYSLRELVERVHRVLGRAGESTAPQSFIVHGHDESAKLALKNYLQNSLKLPEPIILHEQPNWGHRKV